MRRVTIANDDAETVIRHDKDIPYFTVHAEHPPERDVVRRAMAVGCLLVRGSEFRITQNTLAEEIPGDKMTNVAVIGDLRRLDNGPIAESVKWSSLDVDIITLKGRSEAVKFLESLTVFGIDIDIELND